MGHDRVWKWWPENLTAYLPSRMVGGWSSDTQEGLSVSINCSGKQRSGRFCLDLNWHSLLLISAHRHGIFTIFHHLLIPVIIIQESHTLFNPGVKVSCFAFLPWFCQVCWILQWFCFRFPFYFTSTSQWESFRKQTQASLYTVKKVIVFPVPSLDVTNQTLPGRE